jgi:hypothetical protein
MRLIGSRCVRHLGWALSAGCVGGFAGCSVYDQNPPAGSAGGAAQTAAATTGAGTDPSSTSTGAAGADVATTATTSGAGGASGDTTVGTSGGASGSSGDGGMAGSAGSGSGGAATGGSGIDDASTNDGPPRDAGSTDEAETIPPLDPQTLPPHGIDNLTNLAAPFTSACNADEVVIGFSIRAGAWTDAIAAICAKFSAGVLGAIRILPLNGKPDGGNPQQMLCPTGFVASGVVGNYGHSIRFNVDEMTGLGVPCREIADSSNVQIVAISQTPLDTDGGMISFREDCTTTRWLTSIAGTLDNNAISGQSVVRFGGECNAR